MHSNLNPIFRDILVTQFSSANSGVLFTDIQTVLKNDPSAVLISINIVWDSVVGQFETVMMYTLNTPSKPVEVRTGKL